MTDFPLTQERATEIIRECAETTWRVAVTRHAHQRMEERGVTMHQVMECLEKGELTQAPEKDESGDWKCHVRRIASGMEVTIVAAIEISSREDQTIVITVLA